MNCLNETLYFLYLSFSAGLIGFNDYAERLNELLLEDKGENHILLELQSCTGNLKKTISLLDLYLFEKMAQLDYQAVGRMLVNEVRRQYDNGHDNLKQLTHSLYNIWRLLPEKVAEKEPFNKLKTIDDPWSGDGKDTVIEEVNWLFDYYKNTYKKTAAKALFMKPLYWFMGFCSGIIVSAIVNILIPKLENNFLLIWMMATFVISFISSAKFIFKTRNETSETEWKAIEGMITKMNIVMLGEIAFIILLLTIFIKEIKAIVW